MNNDLISETQKRSEFYLSYLVWAYRTEKEGGFVKTFYEWAGMKP